LLKAGFRKNAADLEKAASIVSLLGVVAISMAAVGIVGLVGYSVTQRTKEIAIRIALGAKRMQVLTAVLQQFCWPLGLGLVIGAAIAATLSSFLRKVLYGVSHLDPLSYAAAIAVLLLIVAISAVAPIRRALRLDLAKTLHYE
jgi:ABC-type antimicrobial peptide transport system permease subunit